MQLPREGSQLRLGDARTGVLVEELNGFRFPTAVTQCPIPALPSFIPQIYPTALSASYRLPTVALPLKRFISPHGRSFERGQTTLAGLKEAGVERVMLVATDQDPLLEWVWQERERFVAEVANSQVSVVAGPAFSIYVEDQPLDHLANTAKSFEIYRMLSEAGVATLPACGFTSRIDAQKMGEWVNTAKVKGVLVDLQLAEAAAWPLALTLLPAFLGRAPNLEVVVVNGIGHPTRILQLRELLREHTAAKVSFVTTQPYFMAVYGTEYFTTKTGAFTTLRSDAKREPILRSLYDFYAQLCDSGRSSYQPVGRPFLGLEHGSLSQSTVGKTGRSTVSTSADDAMRASATWVPRGSPRM
jgi:hypothetical protein